MLVYFQVVNATQATYFLKILLLSGALVTYPEHPRRNRVVTFALQGNDGMSISETDLDSLGLVSLSYGNQGLNPDLVVESGCTTSNGTVDCTGETVQVCPCTPEYVRVRMCLASTYGDHGRDYPWLSCCLLCGNGYWRCASPGCIEAVP